MKIGPIVLALRAATTRFGNNIAGAVELGMVLDGGTLNHETAFVVPVADKPDPNKESSGINQKVIEGFVVIVALATDTNKKDKLSIATYDNVHDVRTELFSAILGMQLNNQESIISYAGGSLVDINRAYLWYQFEFAVNYRLDDDDGVDVGADALPVFEKIYAQWMLDTKNGVLPLPEDATLPQAMFETDLEELITWPHAFGPAFGAAFDSLESKSE